MYQSNFRVYYEDTDAGGVVYYANYLKFAERARTEMLRTMGFEQSTLLKEEGVLFVVRHVEMDLKKSARLDDMISITTEITEINGASFAVKQTMKADEKLLAVLTILLVCVSAKMTPMRLPENILSAFRGA